MQVMQRHARRNPDPWPARLEWLQAASGLVLVVFLAVHGLLVGSILLGQDAMQTVTGFMEGEYIFGRPYPAIISLAAATILLIVLFHAAVALLKAPASYRQLSTFWRHSRQLHHGATTLWLVQIGSGLLLLALAPVHLYEMLMHPADIGPIASAERVVSGRTWLLDLILIFTAEVHAGAGLYRLIVKWDWFHANASRQRRSRISGLIFVVVIVYISLGLATLGAYLRIGLEQQSSAAASPATTMQQAV